MSDDDRYIRSEIVNNFGIKGQQALSMATVAVVGAGGLGSAVLHYLAAAGVGRLIVVDYDVVSVSNLQRQILYTTNDLGQYKAPTAALRLQAINPNVEIIVNNCKIDVDNVLTIVGAADVIVDCSDNYEVRYIVDNLCKKHNIPFVYGSAEGMAGQVSVFHFKGAGSYADLYPKTKQRHLVGVLSPMPGIIGSIQAMEAIKIITGCAEPLAGKLLVVDMEQNTYNTFEINYCPVKK